MTGMINECTQLNYHNLNTVKDRLKIKPQNVKNYEIEVDKYKK